MSFVQLDISSRMKSMSYTKLIHVNIRYKISEQYLADTNITAFYCHAWQAGNHLNINTSVWTKNNSSDSRFPQSCLNMNCYLVAFTYPYWTYYMCIIMYDHVDSWNVLISESLELPPYNSGFSIRCSSYLQSFCALNTFIPTLPNRTFISPSHEGVWFRSEPHEWHSFPV